MLMFII